MGDFNETPTILVVDDEPHMREMLGVVLADEGWLVNGVGSGKEALAYCREYDPDIVVLDNMMPGMTGMEVARHLIQDGFSAPVILFSAHLDPELRTACHLLGLIPVDKINWVELVLTCKALCSNSRLLGARPGHPDLNVVPIATHAAA
jgi:two-component system, OmpR family, response regulator